MGLGNSDVWCVEVPQESRYFLRGMHGSHRSRSLRGGARLTRAAWACRRLVLHALLCRVFFQLHRYWPTHISCAFFSGVAESQKMSETETQIERRRMRGNRERDMFREFPLSSDFAGAATAGACGLCLAGTYQTASGSSRWRG